MVVCSADPCIYRVELTTNLSSTQAPPQTNVEMNTCRRTLFARCTGKYHKTNNAYSTRYKSYVDSRV